MGDFWAIFDSNKIYNNSKASDKEETTNISTNSITLTLQTSNISSLTKIQQISQATIANIRSGKNFDKICKPYIRNKQT